MSDAAVFIKPGDSIKWRLGHEWGGEAGVGSTSSWHKVVDLTQYGEPVVEAHGLGHTAIRPERVVAWEKGDR